MLEYIDSRVTGLQNRHVTPQSLEEVRLQQTEPWPLNVGYLDYVTDTRCDNYVRLYVGQSIKSSRRILIDHAQSILQGRCTSLHYFIVWLGNGHRRANFLRLWSLPHELKNSPERQVLSNILETLFIRVFQTDHGSCSPRRANSDGATSLRFGLNILSPLLQNSKLDEESARLPFVTPVKDSPDLQIRLWDSARRKMKERDSFQDKPKLSMKPQWKAEDFLFALKRAIKDQGCLADVYNSLRSEPDVPPHLPEEWFDKANHGVASVSPIGCMTAPICFILDFASAIDNDLRTGLITGSKDLRTFPWALERTGFDACNALVWNFDFQRYGILDPLRLRNPRQSKPLQDLNRLMIRKSASKVVLVCGPRAYAVATSGVVRDKRQSSRYLTLRCGYQLEFFVSQDDGHVPTRLYIRCPELPANVYSINMSKALMISELFKFVATLTGLTNIRPYFMESSSVLFGIVKARNQENSGGEKTTLAELNVSFKLWLRRKGFEDKDMEKLEQVGQGIIQGLIVLLHCLPQSSHSFRSQDGISHPDSLFGGRTIRWDGWNKLDPEMVSAVRNLYREVCRRNVAKHGEDMHRPKRLKRDCGNENALQALQNSANDCDAAYRNSVDDASPEDFRWILEMADDLQSGTAADSSQDAKTSSCEKGKTTREHQSMTRVTSVQNWSLEAGTDLLYEYKVSKQTNWNLKVCFVQIPVPASVGFVPGQLTVQIEIADEGQTHDRLFAQDARVDDVARRIGFRIRGKNADGAVVEYYPVQRGYASVAKTNTLADKVIHGDETMAISKRPRRFLYLDPPHSSWAPELQKFVGGGYTTNGKEEQDTEYT